MPFIVSFFKYLESPKGDCTLGALRVVNTWLWPAAPVKWGVQ